MTSIESLIKAVANSVYTKLGSHHREYIYRRALVVELHAKQNFVEEEVDIPITYTTGSKKITLGIERADIILEQFCILEIKCGSPKPATVANALGQARRYMRYYEPARVKVAFVIFFGDCGVQLYRVKDDFALPSLPVDTAECGGRTRLSTMCKKYAAKSKGDGQNNKHNIFFGTCIGLVNYLRGPAY